MKTIGLLGGMSWESSIEYYRLINEGVKAHLGGLHSAKSIMYSVDFAEIEALQHAGNWSAAGALLATAAQGLVAAGADIIVICTNTMHLVADTIAAAVPVPLVHIADATATAIQRQGLHKIGLLGTRFTMEETFYKGRLTNKYGLEVLIPTADERAVVHQVIYDELCLGQVRSASKARYIKIMQELVARGAEGIILGCTEIGLLIHQEDSTVPLFDTTVLHAEAAVAAALA